MTDRRIDHIVKDFGNAIGAPDLAFDKAGFLAITTDDGLALNVEFFEEDDVLVVYTTAGEIPEEHRFDLYEEMLKANFFWGTTGGTTLCIDPEGGYALVTAKAEASTIEAEGLSALCLTLCRVAALWRERVADMVEELETIDDADGARHDGSQQFA